MLQHVYMFIQKRAAKHWHKLTEYPHNYKFVKTVLCKVIRNFIHLRYLFYLLLYITVAMTPVMFDLVM